MISLISYIIVILGAFNWLSIGVLQFDFIAGIFGSQANIFSRVVYAIVGFSAFWLIYATIKQRGRIIVNGKRANDAKLLGKLNAKLTKDKDKDKETDREHEHEERVENEKHEERKAHHETSAPQKIEAVATDTPE